MQQAGVRLTVACSLPSVNENRFVVCSLLCLELWVRPGVSVYPFDEVPQVGMKTIYEVVRVCRVSSAPRGIDIFCSADAV